MPVEGPELADDGPAEDGPADAFPAVLVTSFPKRLS